ncbi:AAA family ATPase [Photobacterium aphoticum]|uniref:Cytidyltransferase n=1 Tax=Photobacterium aphoticum TaxID=754436 RepID=A0A0J1GG37_9GAMM|nr:AAA family ATPase [Photobacterium aphoticum]KLU98468.1 cytidyltransferase [Photobacterium aphoticum]PSU57411.1 cytidyltransferase [Photobacterium aphoticum]
MQSTPKIGLTLGKYAPFHKGHEYLIEQALQQVDTLYVMIYPTDVMSVPLKRRAAWITVRFPQVRIIEAWGGPQSYGDTPAIKREQEVYILEKTAGLGITHFFSSEFYGAHVSQALGAHDVRIDEARSVVPISATQIRQDPYAHRAWMSPHVYRDLITKVCFMGAPSTGKSTLTQAMAAHCQTVFMPEYGATYWFEHQVDRRLSLEQFEEIAPEHVRQEQALLQDARGYLFSDTCPITTYVFAKDYHGTVGPQLDAYASRAEKDYDLFVVCDTDIPYTDTWDRSGDQKREWFQQQILDDLHERRVPYLVVNGDLDSRIAQVSAVLRQFEKFAKRSETVRASPEIIQRR